MNKKLKFVILVLVCLVFVGFALSQIVWPNLYFGRLLLLHPQGLIASRQKSLIITAVLIMLVIVAPVLITAYYFAIKYRASNQMVERDLNWHGSTWHQILWWLLPSTIIVVLSVLTWKSAHQLDPFKPINSTNPPLTIQVVALDWKWLFIYPAQHIATVNIVKFPQNTPINFQLTADQAPMSAFWIPELGGQMAAMAGMSTQLHLIANQTGEYHGFSTEINGKGFSGMKFTANSVTDQQFSQWVGSVHASSVPLTPDAYSTLIKPSVDNPQEFYGAVDENLYKEIIKKYYDSSSHHEDNN